ncbi:MAG: 16S rRNA (guanine(527)-N(7))-methyltransferase RsmG [Cellvibrionales bacterium]|nr:16S rRNA (guanine(527)-N(7))-methyltransferase RsmG [Cellvibrionales bacterium]
MLTDITEQLARQIHQKAALLPVEVSEAQSLLMAKYLRLLEKWNSAFNLTAIRQIDEMLDRHLIDSLSIAPFIDCDRLLDVGTGPGLPGIPLSIMQPNMSVTLLDSNGKKTRFLNQAKLELNLTVDVIHARVESFKPQMQFTGIVSRAFTSLDDMLEKTRHLLSDHGKLFAMKGKYPSDELAELNSKWNRERIRIESIDWQGLDSERHLVIFSP